MSSVINKTESKRYLKDTKIIFGYLRISNSKLSNDLINLCITFYHEPIDPFIWNKEQCGPNVIIIDNIRACNPGGGWEWVFAKCIISSELCDTYSFSIRFDKNKFNIMTGFINAPIEKSINMDKQFKGSFYTWGEYTSYNFGVWCDYNGHFSQYGCGTADQYISDEVYEYKEGGVIKWKIDFVEKKAYFYYNDELVGIPYTTFGNEIIPTISLCDGCEISCIHWEAT